ncbi:MAG: LysM peptidoglycan-binding domain-containing protein [Anaerolineales bacterium]|nr:LysM peptidoglycan-binding domain-containing protein [Anaerolineales bacterium]
MSESEPKAADVILAYRRRRERLAPLLLGGLAVVLLVVGIFMVVLWMTGENPPALPGFLASDTPMPTETATDLPPTDTPTITLTLPPSETPTPTGPQTYTVELGDSLWTIAEQFGLEDIRLLMAVNEITDPDAIFVGQELIIPGSEDVLPTVTPLPATLLPGQKIEYRVEPGDTLETIASKFNSTAEAIAEENEIDDPNTIGVGQVLIIPVNIATPTPTFTSEPGSPTATESE